MHVPLEQSAFVRALGSRQRELLRSRARLSRFEEGDFLYHVGRPAERLWLVASGEVRTLRTDPSGRTTMLESLHPGDLFGLAAVIPGSAYAETAQGFRSGQAWSLSRQSLDAALKNNAEIAQALLPVVAARLQRAHDRLCSFAHESVAARMARTLLEADDGERIETTRRGLAEAVGTTVETAIRVLRRFERSGWIQGGVGWIQVIDPDVLAAIARGERASPERGREAWPATEASPGAGERTPR